MPKRFTDTLKWSDPWFRKLSPKLKTFWSYICDNCDLAGAWKVDFELASFQINDQVTEQEVIEAFGNRIRILDKEHWFIEKFVHFQYGELSPECRPHQAILSRLNTLSIPYTKGIGRDKEKDKDKEKDQEGGAGGEKYAEARIVLHVLNNATGKHFRELDSNLSIIAARLSEPEVTLDGVRTMITRQCQRWQGTDQEEYLRPETLFGKQKFDNYYAAKDQPISRSSNGAANNASRVSEAMIHKLTESCKKDLSHYESH